MEPAAVKENMDRRLTRAWLWAVLAGTPLVYGSAYFDITEVKTVWFVVCSALYLTGRMVCRIQFGGAPFRLTLSGAAALAFCFVTLMASLSSGFFRASVLGSEGRWQGMGMLWLYAALWASLGTVPLEQKDLLPPLAVGLAVSAAVTIVNHLGLDPLRMLSTLGPFDRGRYIGTLGNIDFAAAYLSLTVPATAWGLLTGRSSRARAGLGAAYVLGLWAAMAVRSECAVLGLGVGLAALPLVLPDRGSLRRWCWLLPGTAALVWVYGFFAGRLGARFSELTGVLLQPAALLLAAVLGAASALPVRRADPGRVRRGYARVLLAVFGLAAAALFLLNTAFSDLPLGSWESWLRFSDEWGTDRVRVWRHCLAFWKNFGLWEKVFGGGCGILARLDVYDRVFPDAILDAAHCEYIQLLLNWGILGLAGYAAWLLTSAREGLRRGGELSRALLPGLAAYAAQAAFNIAQAPGIPLFFVLLAAQRAAPVRKSPEASEKTEE